MFQKGLEASGCVSQVKGDHRNRSFPCPKFRLGCLFLTHHVNAAAEPGGQFWFPDLDDSLRGLAEQVAPSRSFVSWLQGGPKQPPRRAANGGRDAKSMGTRAPSVSF